MINQYGRQIVVMVFDDICLGRRVVPLEVGGRPEKIFSNVDVFLDLEVTCDTSNFRVVGGGVGGRAWKEMSVQSPSRGARVMAGLKRVGSSLSLASPHKVVTPLDWPCVFAIQCTSMISILSTTYVFSTAVFMVRAWGATDEAKAAAHAGLMIAAKPAFSAISSYWWGSAGDRLGFRPTLLVSSAITAVLTAALGLVTSFGAAIALRALSGLFDGVMTLTRSSMAKISDKTNSAKAFSTFGVTYGLGSTIGPTLSAVLAYPCGGDPNARNPNKGLVFTHCPYGTLREYPFALSAGWVLAAAAFLWGYAWLHLRVEEPKYVGVQEDDVEITADVERAVGAGDVEMTTVGVHGGGETLLPIEVENRGNSHTCSSPGVEGGESIAEVRPVSAAKGESIKVDKGEDGDEDEGGPTPVRGGYARVDDGDGAERSDWRKDLIIRRAVINQVGCTFVVIAGAEATPIWMATSRMYGGLGFTSVDIGAFGSVMGVTILVFAATLFAFLADRFGVTRSVMWACAANGFIFAAHPLAYYAQETSHAGTWVLISIFAVGRGCMGPVVMGGVSLILNNSAPRDQLGKVNGFAGTFSNLARAGAPIVGGALIAGMVHATRTMVHEEDDGGIEFDVARVFPPTWWPFVCVSLGFFALAWQTSSLPRSLDIPRTSVG